MQGSLQETPRTTPSACRIAQRSGLSCTGQDVETVTEAECRIGAALELTLSLLWQAAASLSFARRFHAPSRVASQWRVPPAVAPPSALELLGRCYTPPAWHRLEHLFHALQYEVKTARQCTWSNRPLHSDLQTTVYAQTLLNSISTRVLEWSGRWWRANTSRVPHKTPRLVAQKTSSTNDFYR